MREDDARREEAVERRKKMAEHHLEKPPLQTGEEVSDVGAREEVAFKPDEWTMRRRIAGKLGVLFIALMVLIGFVVVWLMWMIFQRYYAAPEEVGLTTVNGVWTGLVAMSFDDVRSKLTGAGRHVDA